MDQMAESRLRIGAYFGSYRREKGWTLEQVSQMTGISVPTLSKVEHRGQISFDTLLRLVSGLKLNLSEVFEAKPRRQNDGGRFTVTRASEAQPFSTDQQDYLLHAGAIRGKQMVALVMTLKARTPGEFDRWSSHEGEEFVIVISGSVEMHTDFYAPLRLEKGDSVYFDSAMGHIFLNAGEGEAQILSMCTGEGVRNVDALGFDTIRANGSVVPETASR